MSSSGQIRIRLKSYPFVILKPTLQAIFIVQWLNHLAIGLAKLLFNVNLNRTWKLPLRAKCIRISLAIQITHYIQSFLIARWIASNGMHFIFNLWRRPLWITHKESHVLLPLVEAFIHVHLNIMAQEGTQLRKKFAGWYSAQSRLGLNLIEVPQSTCFPFSSSRY